MTEIITAPQCHESGGVAPAEALPSLHGVLHVLTLTPFYPEAGDDGAGCFVAEPLHYLDNIGIHNSVLAVRPIYRRRGTANRTGHPATWMRYAALPGLPGLANSGRWLFKRIAERLRRLHSVQPLSLIHAHAALPCGYAAALISQELGIPFVVSVHGRDVFSSRAGGGAAARCKEVSKWVYKRATRVICISEAVQLELESELKCRTTVVYNGVDACLFSPAPTSGHKPPVVLSIGNLIPSKGHDVLLRAIAQLARIHPVVVCKIIGTGPEQKSLARLASHLAIAERVQFLGRQSREQVADHLRRSTVFALPSYYEGLGCVYLEAMASGKVAIGCTGQGIAEIIKRGENGWLIEPNDSAGLAQILNRILHDTELQRRVGAAARQTILNGFTLEQQAKKLAHIYQECVS